MRKTLACLVALVATAAANAAPLYTQAYDGTGFAFSSQNDTASGFGNYATAYDNFTLTGNSFITGFQWTGVYFNPPAQGMITGFTLSIYADAAGQPGSALATYNIPGTANETSLGNAVFSYEALLGTPFLAQGGTQYWLSIVPDVGFPPQWGWATGTGGDGLVFQDFFGSRSGLQADFAFTVNGTATPEPISLVVFSGLVAGGGWLVRRRMKANVA